MRERLDLVRKQKKLQGKTWDDLAEGLPVNGNAVRVAFSRNSIDEDFLNIIEENLGIRKRTISTVEKKETPPEDQVRFEKLIAENVLKELRPHIDRLTEEIINNIGGMDVELTRIKEYLKEIHKQQEKTHDLIEKKQ